MALVSSDTVEVVRVRYGGFGHRQTTKAGTQMSLMAAPPEQYGVLPEAIRLREDGFLIRCEYTRNLQPAFRFFAKIQENQEWRAL